MIDALKRASAGSITAVMPYFGYARQDRKVEPRTPITAKLVADLLSAPGADRVVVDGPARRPDPGLLQHALRSPVRDAGVPRGSAPRASRRPPVVVSPDAGGVERARAYSKRLGSEPRHHRQAAPSAQRQRGDEHHRRRSRARTACIVDDIIDTAGTLTTPPRRSMDKPAPRACRRARPTRCSPARPSSASRTRRIEEVIVTNTIPLPEAAKGLARSGCSSVAAFSARPSSASTTATRSARCSCEGLRPTVRGDRDG